MSIHHPWYFETFEMIKERRATRLETWQMYVCLRYLDDSFSTPGYLRLYPLTASLLDDVYCVNTQRLSWSQS